VFGLTAAQAPNVKLSNDLSASGRTNSSYPIQTPGTPHTESLRNPQIDRDPQPKRNLHKTNEMRAREDMACSVARIPTLHKPSASLIRRPASLRLFYPSILNDFNERCRTCRLKARLARQAIYRRILWLRHLRI